jgi:hypothetical protein
MFNIDWEHLLLELTDADLRKQRILDYCRVLMAPIKSLWNTNFIPFRERVLRRLLYTCQVESLQRMLNDYYDPQQRRIYVYNVKDLDQVIIYNRLENKPKTFIYNRWKPGFYLENRRVSWKGFIWRCVQVTNEEPGTGTKWESIGPSTVFRQRSEYNQLSWDMGIDIPADVVFDEIQLKARVDYYLHGGVLYKIFIV